MNAYLGSKGKHRFKRPEPWLWEETHILKVVGLNPSLIYWMDIFHIIFCKIVLMFV